MVFINYCLFVPINDHICILSYERYSESHNESHNERVDTYGVLDEYMHCFNALDCIPEYEPMEVENIKDLYETT